jgi:hypothetical protein
MVYSKEIKMGETPKDTQARCLCYCQENIAKTFAIIFRKGAKNTITEMERGLL